MVTQWSISENFIQKSDSFFRHPNDHGQKNIACIFYDFSNTFPQKKFCQFLTILDNLLMIYAFFVGSDQKSHANWPIGFFTAPSLSKLQKWSSNLLHTYGNKLFNWQCGNLIWWFSDIIHCKPSILQCWIRIYVLVFGNWLN